MPQDDRWLPGFNFNVEEWLEGDRYETLAICRIARPGPRGTRGCDRREARRPVHDPQPHAGGVQRRPPPDARRSRRTERGAHASL